MNKELKKDCRPVTIVLEGHVKHFVEVKTGSEDYKNKPCVKCAGYQNNTLCLALPDCTINKTHYVRA